MYCYNIAGDNRRIAETVLLTGNALVMELVDMRVLEALAEKCESSSLS